MWAPSSLSSVSSCSRATPITFSRKFWQKNCLERAVIRRFRIEPMVARRRRNREMSMRLKRRGRLSKRRVWVGAWVSRVLLLLSRVSWRMMGRMNRRWRRSSIRTRNSKLIRIATLLTKNCLITRLRVFMWVRAIPTPIAETSMDRERMSMDRMIVATMAQPSRGSR